MSLQRRLKREKETYNSGEIWLYREKLHRFLGHVYTCPNSYKEENYFWQVMKEKTKESIILDYGCYSGWLCPKFVEFGAKKIIGIDISEMGISEAKKAYGNLAEYYCTDAHRTKFSSETFDFVVGNAILHHLDFEIAVKEIYRVLKPGGYALFHEPLRDNPAAKLIRLITPRTRTKDELPLTRRQIEWADNLFGYNLHRFSNFSSVPLGFMSSFIFNNPDNWMMRKADFIDSLVSQTSFRYWMRSVVLVWKKSS